MKIKVKELLEKANVKELTPGEHYYLVLLDETVDLVDFDDQDVFDPLKVILLQVPDPSTIRIFELEPKDETNSKP